MKIEALRNFFLRLSVQERQDFAKRCGTSANYINQIYGGQRVCSPRLAIEIDKHSGGAVSVDDLCDADWNYIRQQAITQTPSANEKVQS